MLLSVPLSAWGVAYVVSSGLHKPLSWTDTHAAFSTVYTFGDSVALASARVSELSSLQRWVPVFASFAYFCFFGMQEESILTYWSAISWVGRVAGKPFRKGSRIDASVPSFFYFSPRRRTLYSRLLHFFLATDPQTTPSSDCLSLETPSPPSARPATPSQIGRWRISRRVGSR